MADIKEFALPDLGEGLAEGEILRWLVAEGDLVSQNQPIVEVETAKAAVEIPAKWAGRVVRILQSEGTTVPVGTPIVAIDTQPAPRPASPTASRTPVLVGYGPKPASVAQRSRRSAARPAEAPEQQWPEQQWPEQQWPEQLWPRRP